MNVPAIATPAKPSGVLPAYPPVQERPWLVRAAPACHSQLPSEYQILDFSDVEAPQLTHRLFRFPAKFHPPVAHALIREYTIEGETVLDPFCGSGTLLLAAAAEGRRSIGTDIDPLAVFVARAKTHRLHPKRLRASWDKIRPSIEGAARPPEEYDRLRFDDISLDEYERTVYSEALWAPAIQNLFHWFRRYVIIDLARILAVINSAAIPNAHRNFFKLIFASIIRKSSNADPIPVSGLEVTAYMRKLEEAGRLVNPIALCLNAAEKGIAAMQSYWESPNSVARASVFEADAASLSSRIRKQVDAVVTSPPYHNAVDYYRRHQLEMFWLGLTESREDRLKLLPKYIGRSSVSQRDPMLRTLSDMGRLAAALHRQLQEASLGRANAFAHYVLAMKKVFDHLSAIVRVNGKAVFVLGHNEWNGSKIPTADLFMEIAAGAFDLIGRLCDPVRNRHMSYARRHGANIDQEYVLVFRRSNR